MAEADTTRTRKRSAMERAIERRRAEIMPLEKFPPEHRARIEAAVAAPEPPPREFPVGGQDTGRPIAWLPSRAWLEWHFARGIYPGLRRSPLPKWLRQAVIERDGYVCQLCGGDVDPADVHLDHIKPRSKGGHDVASNLQVAHSLCNMRKGARY